MKKNVLCLALGLVLSVTAVAENRQAIANLPSNTPTVTLTIDGKNKQVQPPKVIVKEKSESSINCIVKAGKDKAQVTLPISYDLFVTFCYRSAGLAAKDYKGCKLPTYSLCSGRYAAAVSE